MPAPRKLSRLESNKEVRRILVRYHVDLSQLKYSCCGRSLCLSGSLGKEGGRNFSVMEIDSMLQEIYRLQLSIQSELTNWEISSGAISKRQSSEEKMKEMAHNAAHKHTSDQEKKKAS